ncbi:MAG: glycerol-3-phosphate 1-O-acyltransferase [Bacteroidetes bacterium]|nr:MAG: glycerol-3-phosphate 1-O-acyltransferase [Bacteroidota bacterium]
MILFTGIFAIVAYLLGSIPSAVWVGKSFYQTDVREHGSKNAGATNTFRILGKKAGIIVLLIDILKGAAAVFLPLTQAARFNAEELIILQLVAGASVFLGHVFPLFAQFRGGKGVATSLGIIIAIHPPAAGMCAALFLFVFIISHYVSLGAMCAACLFPIAVIFIFGSTSLYLNLFSILIAATVIVTHKKNILRLWKGEENKMNLFKR